MTVSITQTTNIAALEDLEVYLGDIQINAQSVADRVYQQIKPLLLDELRFYPPVPPGSRYKRTFRLRDGWTVELDKSSDGFRLVIRNRTPYTQWVVGSLAQSPGAAARFQRDFHRRNGWPLATNTARFWFDAFAESFEKEFVNELGEFARTATSRRAATRIR